MVQKHSYAATIEANLIISLSFLALLRVIQCWTCRPLAIILWKYVDYFPQCQANSHQRLQLSRKVMALEKLFLLLPKRRSERFPWTDEGLSWKVEQYLDIGSLTRNFEQNHIIFDRHSTVFAWVSQHNQPERLRSRHPSRSKSISSHQRRPHHSQRDLTRIHCGVIRR